VTEAVVDGLAGQEEAFRAYDLQVVVLAELGPDRLQHQRSSSCGVPANFCAWKQWRFCE
jgi:hypothetical protein